MKTRLLTAMALLLSSLGVMSQEVVESKDSESLGHGYRAFLDVELLEDVAIGFSTTHGYQFNSNFYAGAGVSYVTHIGGSSPYVLTDFRFDNIVSGKNTPFMNVRFSLNKDFFVVRPTLGYRFNHLNLGLGYWFGNNGDNFFSFSVGIDLGGRKK